MKAAAVGALFVLGTVFLAADYLESHRAADKVVIRNAQGGGSRKEAFEVRLQGEKEKTEVEIDVAEQQ